MAGIASLGVGSGLDLTNLVNTLVAAERAPVENSLNRRESSLSTELSGIGLMRSALDGFKSSLSTLSDSANFSTRNVSNNQSGALSVTASNEASVGQYNIEVTNLATSQSLASQAYTDPNEVVGTGTIQIRFGAITGPGFTSFTADPNKSIQTLNIDATNNTLAGVRDYINENEFGVTASIVNDGTGYRLTLLSESTGANSALELSVTDSGDGNNLDALGLSSLAFNASAANLVETQAAEDAAIKINGLVVTAATNTLTQVIEGVTLSLKEETAGAIANISISEDTSDLTNSIEELVEGYNSMMGTLRDLTNVDPEGNQAGILVGNATLRVYTSQIRSLLSSPIDGLSGSITALTDLGISTQLDGSLSIDETKFSNAIQDNPMGALALFAEVGQTSDNQVEFLASTDSTAVGTYALNITQLATRSVFNGASVLAFPQVIDADNDNFSITVDGTASGDLSITQGSYTTGAELAAEIQLQINSASAIADAGKGVAVSFDSANNRFNIESNSYGSQSKLSINSVDTNTAAQLGFSVLSGTDGVDVAGTIGGLAATGSGQTLTGSSGAATGLKVDITGGATGNRGSLTFTRGIMDELNGLLDAYLDGTGVLSAKEDGLKVSLDQISDEREALELKLESVEARLIAKFSALDALVARFQSTGNFLTQQLANLPGFERSSRN